MIFTENGTIQYYLIICKLFLLNDLDFWISQSLIRKLSWTHIVRLLSVRDENERSFYIIETVENSWSVRELDIQINSSLYERLALSLDKKWVLELSKKWQIIQTHNDVLKDPYVLEFLWLEEKSSYSETDLETSTQAKLVFLIPPLSLGEGWGEGIKN